MSVARQHHRSGDQLNVGVHNYGRFVPGKPPAAALVTMAHLRVLHRHHTVPAYSILEVHPVITPIALHVLEQQLPLQFPIDHFPDDFAESMPRARVDNSVEGFFRSFVSPGMPILDDLGFHRLTDQQSTDLYELFIGRHRAPSFIFTSNRAAEDWLSFFDDPIMGDSALDPLSNASYQIVMEDAGYRESLSPHRAPLQSGG